MLLFHSTAIILSGKVEGSCNLVQQRFVHWRISCIIDCLFKVTQKEIKSKFCRKGSNQFSFHSFIWDLKSNNNWVSSQNFLQLNFVNNIKKTQWISGNSLQLLMHFPFSLGSLSLILIGIPRENISVCSLHLKSVSSICPYRKTVI